MGRAYAEPVTATSEQNSARSFPEPLLELPSFLMAQLVREGRRLGGQLSSDRLRAPHVAVLACVAEFGPVSQKDISDRLRIDASDLVALLDDLEREGLANRTRDERDRRRYAVSLTEAGQARLSHRLADAQALNERLLEPLDAAERADLHRLLLRVFAHHAPHRLPPQHRG
jgi:DNA-binding MarR family transcriptional regulator